MNYWTPTREWEGQTAVVLASGPSMTREVAETVRVAGVRSIAVNNQAIKTNGRPAMAPWADILYAADYTWWHHNKAEALAFPGRKVSLITADNHARWTSEFLQALLFFQHGGVVGFDERPGYIRTGSNSGYQGVHLAIKLGARRIIMCGFDMHGKNGEHWFGFHSWRNNYQARYNVFVNEFARGAPALKARAEIINATPGSALTCFPLMSLEDALNGVPVLSKGEKGSKGAAAKKHRGVESTEGVKAEAVEGAQ